MKKREREERKHDTHQVDHLNLEKKKKKTRRSHMVLPYVGHSKCDPCIICEPLEASQPPPVHGERTRCANGHGERAGETRRKKRDTKYLWCDHTFLCAIQVVLYFLLHHWSHRFSLSVTVCFV